MAVEQALKAILILYGIEYPKKHDISNLYLSLKEKRIPKFFSKKIDVHAKLLNYLVQKRDPAAYGSVEGTDISEFEKDAKNLKK
ncbi:MAG: HEPN domain-containing protein [Candidatus Lokiarchaeota archaeon]|nr:HEPN domain-containing protein [Candidatus Lokiarchaeota archaeon]MBD3339036.1 HEPN domain-containing protein [Candidatus Lokiarchaeota archaeon]